MLLDLDIVVNMTIGLRAVKYRRISDDREGLSLGVQRQDEDLDALAARLGVVIVGDYCDNDISASTKSKKERPRYKAMLADAKAGQFDVILAYTTKRITRRPRENEDLIELGEKHGIRFFYVMSPSFDLNTANGRMIARIMAAQDANEAEELGERVQRKVLELASDGKISGGGTRPFGYEQDRLTIRESEAVHIRDAVKRLLAGTTTFTGLCREWNQRGVETVTGTQWKVPVLRNMLRSARISGRREHKHVITAKAVWPGIISAEDSDRIREMLNDPSRKTNIVGPARSYLLTGYLWCGIEGCGMKLKARPQGDHQKSYVCADIGYAHLRMIAEPLELYVTEAALDYLDEFVNLAAMVKQASESSTGDQTAGLATNLDNYERRLKEVERARWVLETMSEETYQHVATELHANIKHTREQLVKVHAKTTLTDMPANSAIARTQWEQKKSDLEWRRAFLLTLIERISVGKGVKGRNRFDPARVRITWRKLV